MNRERILRFREVSSQWRSSSEPASNPARRGPDRRKKRGLNRSGQATLVGVGIWLLGLLALGAVIQFERRVDETRRAQVVIAQMRNQQGALIQIAFDPAVAGTNDAPARAATRIR